MAEPAPIKGKVTDGLLRSTPKHVDACYMDNAFEGQSVCSCEGKNGTELFPAFSLKTCSLGEVILVGISLSWLGGMVY